MELLALSLVFAGFIWWSVATGEAMFRFPLSRAKNPVGFWLVQALWGVIGVACIFGGLDSIFQFVPR
jgi:hypothetical protein